MTVLHKGKQLELQKWHVAFSLLQKHTSDFDKSIDVIFVILGPTFAILSAGPSPVSPHMGQLDGISLHMG